MNFQNGFGSYPSSQPSTTSNNISQIGHMEQEPPLLPTTIIGDMEETMETNSFSQNMDPYSNNLQPVYYKEPSNWCSVAYYELSTRLSEIFYSQGNTILIDGFTNPGLDTNRFCLGQISNINRNSSIERTRRHIGQGKCTFTVKPMVIDFQNCD